MVVIVMGVAGAGKTAVGSGLADALGWPFYDADDLHPAENVRKMTSGIPLSDEDRRPWLESLVRLVTDCGKREENAVLACSALRQAYRDQLTSAGVETVIVYVKADPSLPGRGCPFARATTCRRSSLTVNTRFWKSRTGRSSSRPSGRPAESSKPSWRGSVSEPAWKPGIALINICSRRNRRRDNHVEGSPVRTGLNLSRG
jgi:hypothetical protein